MKSGTITSTLIYLAGIFFHPAHATSTVEFHGTLMQAPNCRINEDQPVKAEFGTIQTDSLSAASADVPVTIACDFVPSGTLSISIDGTVSDFNTDAIQSDIEGLGVTLQTEQGEVITPNKYYNVSKDLGLTSKVGSLTLKAGLTSDGETELPGGEFNASATLVLQVS